MCRGVISGVMLLDMWPLKGTRMIWIRPIKGRDK
uniref:Uncharacterized protein n=1 Tax=Anguilla anguilla TaxID=7936 RepID=A0A0E9VUC0_ANGAN